MLPILYSVNEKQILRIVGNTLFHSDFPLHYDTYCNCRLHYAGCRLQFSAASDQQIGCRLAAALSSPPILGTIRLDR